MGFLYFIFGVVALIIGIYVASEFRNVAAAKGFDSDKYFHICFWLGLVGYLLVIALPDRGNQESSPAPAPAPAAEPEAIEAPEDWQPVSETAAILVGESNVRCRNCHRLQFKGNRTCAQCGARFTQIIE